MEGYGEGVWYGGIHLENTQRIVLCLELLRDSTFQDNYLNLFTIYNGEYHKELDLYFIVDFISSITNIKSLCLLKLVANCGHDVHSWIYLVSTPRPLCTLFFLQDRSALFPTYL